MLANLEEMIMSLEYLRKEIEIYNPYNEQEEMDQIGLSTRIGPKSL